MGEKLRLALNPARLGIFQGLLMHYSRHFRVCAKDCVVTCLFGGPRNEHNCAVEKNVASVHPLSKCSF